MKALKFKKVIRFHLEYFISWNSTEANLTVKKFFDLLLHAGNCLWGTTDDGEF